MWERFTITMKIASLSNKIKSMENDIINYRQDMELINNLYYCGRGDVDTYIVEWSQAIHFKILACSRLKFRFEDQLNKLNGVVGKS
jgi:hypothetical protein